VGERKYRAGVRIGWYGGVLGTMFKDIVSGASGREYFLSKNSGKALNFKP
jgi:hypothetical protein